MRRRNFLAASGALIVAVAGGAAWKHRTTHKHSEPTPYDDLLNRLDDREAAAKCGVAALAALPAFTPQTGAEISKHGPGFGGGAAIFFALASLGPTEPITKAPAAAAINAA